MKLHFQILVHFLSTLCQSIRRFLSLSYINQKRGKIGLPKATPYPHVSPCLAFPKEPKCVVLWAPVLIWQVRKYISSCFNRFNAFQRTSRNESSSWLSSYSSVLHGQTYELMHQLGHIRSLWQWRFSANWCSVWGIPCDEGESLYSPAMLSVTIFACYYYYFLNIKICRFAEPLF